MKVLILQDDLFAYLQHVTRAYAGGGIDPDEGLAIYQLNQALKGVQTVDETQIAKIKEASFLLDPNYKSTTNIIHHTSQTTQESNLSDGIEVT